MKRVLTAVSLCFVSILHAQVDAKLADAAKHAKVALDAGLKASEREGKPISGKFELDEGKLQLSVYTEKAGKVLRSGRGPHIGKDRQERRDHQRR